MIITMSDKQLKRLFTCQVLVSIPISLICIVLYVSVKQS